VSSEKLWKKRGVVHGTGSVAAVLLVVGILVVAALLANRYYLRWDLTRERTQSLSPMTRSLLGQATKPLTLTIFYSEGGPERQNAREQLQKYLYVNPQITVNFADPERQPEKAREAGFRHAGNVLMEYEGRRQMADRLEEEAIANTLRKLLKPEGKKVYFLTGQGERDIEDPKAPGMQAACKALENEGYEVKPLNLLTQAEAPQDAAAVVVAAPQKPLVAQEVSGLKNYLGRGGKILVMLEPFQDGGLQDFLAGYGIGLDDGMVLDLSQVALGLGLEMPMIFKYGPHRITQDFKLATVFPRARPLMLKREGKDMALLPLATTMPSSWEKLGKDWMKGGKVTYDEKKDKKGPFTLAALAEIPAAVKNPEEKKEQAPEPQEKKSETAKGYLVVFGSADFAANAYFNLFGNGDLFLNTVNFLAAEEKQIIIRKDEKRPATFILTRSQAWVLFLLSLVLIPLVLAGGGIYAYRRRRALR